MDGVKVGTMAQNEFGISSKVFNELRATANALEKNDARLKGMFSACRGGPSIQGLPGLPGVAWAFIV